MELTIDVKIDCRGMNCPMPAVKTKKALGQIESGQVLEVTATDPGSKSDIPAVARNMGAEVLETKDLSDSVVFLIKKR